MSNVQRQIFAGAMNEIAMDCDSAQAVEVGDLLYNVSDVATPTSALTDTTTLAGNQEAIHDAFIGVSRSAHRAAVSGFVADSTSLDIAVRGVFRFPVVSSSGYVRGDLVGVDEQDSGTAVHAQRVIKVAAANLSIGTIVKVVSATEVWVEIASTLFGHGLQATA